MMPNSEEGSGPREAHWFATTHWSVVLAAGGDSSLGARPALENLCSAYWYPLYAYARRKGHGPDDSQDLVQAFFDRFLELKYVRLAKRSRGRFRCFLLSSLNNFLINEWIKANREKRGGGKRVLSLDEEMAESRFTNEPSIAQSSDSFYDRIWAATLLKRALAALRVEFEQSGKASMFERLVSYSFRGKDDLPCAHLARELGMTQGAVRVAANRLHKRYVELLRADVAKTVSTPAEINEELRYLVAVVRDGHVTLGNIDGEKL